MRQLHPRARVGEGRPHRDDSADATPNGVPTALGVVDRLMSGATSARLRGGRGGQSFTPAREHEVDGMPAARNERA